MFPPSSGGLNLSFSIACSISTSQHGQSLVADNGYIFMFQLFVPFWRLIIVRGDDDKVGRALSEATDNYRCELAVRNINLSEYFTWKL